MHVISSPVESEIVAKSSVKKIGDICETFPNRLRGGGAEGEKCSRYHQNSDEIGFLLRFDPFSCHHWGSEPGLSQRDIKFIFLVIYLFILPRNWHFHPRMTIHAVVSMITEENIGYHILNIKHTYDTMIQQTALRKA